MKLIFRILKKTFFFLFGIGLLLAVVISLFINFYPSFGGDPSAEDQKLYEKKTKMENVLQKIPKKFEPVSK